MIILGIHDGHNASAAILKNGKLVCSIAEERLTRNKHEYGFPGLAIKAVLKTAGMNVKDLDRIAMATATLPPAYFLTSRN